MRSGRDRDREGVCCDMVASHRIDVGGAGPSTVAKTKGAVGSGSGSGAGAGAGAGSASGSPSSVPPGLLHAFVGVPSESLAKGGKDKEVVGDSEEEHSGRVLVEATARAFLENKAAFGRTQVLLMGRAQQDGRYSFTLSDEWEAYCEVQGGVCFGCIVDSAFSRASALAFLHELRDAFSIHFAGRSGHERDAVKAALLMQAGPTSGMFAREVRVLMVRFSEMHASGDAKLGDVMAQVNDVRAVMIDNIDKVLDRGEKLDYLMDKSGELRNHADRFRQGTTDARRTVYWKNMRMNLCIGLGVILVIAVITLSICGAAGCFS